MLRNRVYDVSSLVWTYLMSSVITSCNRLNEGGCRLVDGDAGMEERESCKFEKAVGLEGPVFALVRFGPGDILAPQNKHVTTPITTPTSKVPVKVLPIAVLHE